MGLVSVEFGSVWFSVLSLVVSGGLFLLWRRLFRRLFRSEAVVLIGTAMAAIIMTPVVMLGALWLWALVTK
ncbi:MAG TPA: hypothetical protein VFO93_13570 [Hymenobacter sp.]|uniref:hypothetical protein n=1 Tax=Hymenobacter sp. TaxID=1898978 RepID=UPI002D80C22E|nr:hypothetical protein [Hymenobacter sp.]HET9504564.1 hypothetical protein [Hymenobacter sp.]